MWRLQCKGLNERKTWGGREGWMEGGMENMKDGWRAKDGQKNKYG